MMPVVPLVWTWCDPRDFNQERRDDHPAEASHSQQGSNLIGVDHTATIVKAAGCTCDWKIA